MKKVVVHFFTDYMTDQFIRNKDISPYITLKTPAVAEYYIEARSRDELIAAVKAAAEQQLPVTILGGGSNVAVLYGILKGLVIRNQYSKKELVKDNGDTVDLLVASGYPMGLLVRDTVAAGYEGFEYHLGLPGTIGGALYMNSKWTKPSAYCGDSLLSATILNHAGEERQVDRAYFQFAYDYSILQKTKEIVLEAVFRLKKNDPSILKQRADAALAYRKQTQPFGVSTSGCFFQNISEADKERLQLPTTSAGYLIDHAGLKGTQVGGFVVSDKHANFIVNTGKTSPDDLVQLVDTIKKKVSEQFGVQLEEEVIVLDQ